MIEEGQKWIHKVTNQKVEITFYNEDDVYGYFVKDQVWIHRVKNDRVVITAVQGNDVYFETEEGERSEQKEAFELEFKKPPDVAFRNIQRNENDQEYDKLKVDFVRMYKLDLWDTSDGEISLFELGNEAHRELQESRGNFWDEAAQTWQDKFTDYISDMYDLGLTDLATTLSTGEVFEDDNSDSIVYILKIDVEAKTVLVADPGKRDELTIIDIYQFTENYTFYAPPAELPAYVVVVQELLTPEKLNTLHDIWNTQTLVDAVVVNPDRGIWVENITFPEEPEPRSIMFGKMFTVEQFRKNPLIDDDYALIIKYLDEELDCDIGISIGTRKNPVKIKIKDGDDWDRDKDGFLTIFCAKDLKQWLNTNTGSYGLNANTADQYFENRELHDNNPSKPWQTIVGIQYLTQEEIDEEEKKYMDSKEKDETDELLESIIKKKRDVEILKKELTYLRWNYAVSQFEERAELIKSKIQRITAKIRMLKIQIQQQQNILKWASESKTDDETKLKF